MTTYIIIDDSKYELSLSDRTLFFQEGETVLFIDENGARKSCLVAKVLKVLRRTGNKVDADFEVYLQKGIKRFVTAIKFTSMQLMEV